MGSAILTPDGFLGAAREGGGRPELAGGRRRGHSIEASCLLAMDRRENRSFCRISAEANHLHTALESLFGEACKKQNN